MFFAPWNVRMLTPEEDWRYKDLWVNIVGLPHHLWTKANAKIMCSEMKGEFMEIDKECLAL